jgi:hypothetical protein
VSEEFRKNAELRADWETVALYDRAENGMIPYYVWIKLSKEQQGRLGKVSQTQAGRAVAALIPPEPVAPDPGRTTTAKLAEAAQAVLRENSRK